MSVYLRDPDLTILHGDVLDELRTLPDESVDCVITSPPYWGLRDYGTGLWEGGDEGCDHAAAIAERFTVGGFSAERGGQASMHAAQWKGRPCPSCGARRIDNQLGLESTPEEYVERMVEVFREVRRVLASHGTCWVNLGDSYAHAVAMTTHSPSMSVTQKQAARARGESIAKVGTRHGSARHDVPSGLKVKDLVGIPWRVAFALQADGWWLRSDIVWSKPNPMPESVTDRPTKAHEYLFLLTKSPRYYFDQEAVREDAISPPGSRAGYAGYSARAHAMGREPSGNEKPGMEAFNGVGRNIRSVWEIEQEMLDPSLPPEKPRGPDGRRKTTVQAGEGSIQHREGERWPAGGANVRSVWNIATQPFPEAHFATFPEELVRRALLAGTSERGNCPECGKPWVRRILAVAPDGREAEMRGGKAYDEDGKPLMGDNMFDHGVRGSWNSGGEVLQRETLGWRSSCECPGDLTRPSVVLDIFGGSGTTALVARKHGRRSILIELNESYCAMAAKRLSQQSLFATEIA